MDGTNFHSFERMGRMMEAQLNARRRDECDPLDKWRATRGAGYAERTETVRPTAPSAATWILRGSADPSCASWALFRQVPGERIEVVAAIGATQSYDEVMTVGRARDIYRSLIERGWTRDDSARINVHDVRRIIRD